MRIWPLRLRITPGEVAGERAWFVERWWPERDGVELSGSVTAETLRKAWSMRPRRGTVDRVPGHRVRLVATSSDFTTARLWIDGKEIVGISGVSVRVAVPDDEPGDTGLHAVQIEFIPDELDIKVRARKLDWFEERDSPEPPSAPVF